MKTVPVSVMPDLVPGIHVFRFVDGRDKPGHDDDVVLQSNT
jgi:hypothetical protein